MRTILLLTGALLLAVPAFAQTPPGWQPSNCKYGLEPGGGPMRCANPNDPNSYLNRPKPARPQRQQMTEQGHYARRPAWMPSPQEDPRYCVTHTHSATGLNNCVTQQNQEYIPSQSEVDRAIAQQREYLRQLSRSECINVKHGVWMSNHCDR